MISSFHTRIGISVVKSYSYSAIYCGSNPDVRSFFSSCEFVSSEHLALRIVSWQGTGSEVPESERGTGPEVTESAKQKSDSWSKISTLALINYSESKK